LPSERYYIDATSTQPIPLPGLHDQPSINLSIIIPAYNESLRLPKMLHDALSHLASYPQNSYEFIIVDDGSLDDTVATATSFAAQHKQLPIRIVKLIHNRGKGAAVTHGMLHARGTRLLMVDADGASRFSDLDLLQKALDDLPESAIAVGSRAHLVGTAAVVKRSLVRNFLMHCLHFTLKTLGVGHIKDTQCGFKLFTRAAAQHIFPSIHLSTWMFDVELLMLAQRLNIPVAEVPIHWQEIPGSKLRLLNDSLGMLKDLLILRANYVLGRW